MDMLGGHQAWHFKKKYLRASIVAKLSPLRLKSKNSLPPKALPTSQSDALLAVRKEKLSVTEAIVITVVAALAKCIRLCAPDAERRPWSRLSPAVIGWYTAESVMT